MKVKCIVLAQLVKLSSTFPFYMENWCKTELWSVFRFNFMKEAIASKIWQNFCCMKIRPNENLNSVAEYWHSKYIPLSANKERSVKTCSFYRPYLSCYDHLGNYAFRHTKVKTCSKQNHHFWLSIYLVWRIRNLLKFVFKSS